VQAGPPEVRESVTDAAQRNANAVSRGR
jgi:hypothetical protein